MRRFTTAHLLDIGLSFVVIVWGASPTLFKIALAEVQPLTFVLIRFVLLCLVAVAVLLVQSRRNPTFRPFRIHRQDVWPLILSGLCGYGIYQIFYIEGLFHSTAFAAALLGSTTPVWSAVLLASLRIERIWNWQWVGILISFGGIVWFLLAAPPSISEAPIDHALTTTDIVFGNMLLFFGAALFSMYGIINKRLIRRYSASELMAYTLLIGTVALLPFGVTSAISQDWSHVTWNFWVILVYSVLFPIYITYSIWNWAIGRRGVGYVTLYSYATPVLGGVAGYLALGERLSVAQIVAGAVVLGGMILARWAIIQRNAKDASASHTGANTEAVASEARE